MKKRTLSALLMTPALVLLFLGGVPLLLFTLAATIDCIWEFNNVFSFIGIKAYKSVSISLVSALYVLMFFSYYVDGSALSYQAFLGMWLVIVLMASFALILADKDHNIWNGLLTGFSALYLGFFASFLPLIERLPDGKVLIWYVVFCSVIADIFAYLIGCKFGKHKMASLLSPKKSWEGFFGGMAACTVSCVVFSLIFFKGHIIDSIVIGILGSAVSCAGDLTASSFKRKIGIKDYSNLIPGHGGILDRLDSLLFVCPFVYYYCVLFITKGF